MGNFDRFDELSKQYDAMSDDDSTDTSRTQQSRTTNSMFDKSNQTQTISGGQKEYGGLSQTLRDAMPSAMGKNPSLLPKDGIKLGFFQNLALKREQGLLTKDQLLRSLSLAFETEFKHVSLKCALKLSEANQWAITDFLKQTQVVRRELGQLSAQELVKVRDVYWEGVEQAVNARVEWKNRAKAMLQRGAIDQTEANGMLLKSDEVLADIVVQMEHVAGAIQDNLMSMISDALDVKVNHLIAAGNNVQMPE